MSKIYILRTHGRIRAFSDKSIMGDFVKRHLSESIAKGLDATGGKTYAGFSYKAIEIDGEIEFPSWTKVDKNFFGDADESN